MRLRFRLLGAALAALLVLPLLGAAPAAASDDGDEWDFVARINHARGQAGLAPLTMLPPLRDAGRAQAQRMGAAGSLFHDPNLRANIAAAVPDWQRLGENVGQGSDVAGLHDAFMNSSGHRANVLGDYNYVGVGVVHANGSLWVAVEFVKAPAGKAAAARVPITRVAGPTDSDTSVAVSRFGFADSQSGAVVVGRIDVFADALAGGPLAAVNNGPVLLTVPETASPAVVAEARRVLRPGGTVFLLGGTAALSPEVERAFAAAGLPVERLAGSDRYGTAVEIAKRVNPTPDQVVLVSGVSFADAMVAGPPAAQRRAPIVLTSASSLDGATARYLESVPGATRYVFGGTAVVSDEVAAHAGAAERIAGADRYETAVRVAQRFFGRPQHLSMATGMSFQDALAGSPYSAKAGIPVVLVSPTPTPATAAYVSETSGGLVGGIVYGTTNAVPQATVAQLFG